MCLEGRRYKWVAMGEDVEIGSAAYPTVLVQVPMFNEKQVPPCPLLPFN